MILTIKMKLLNSKKRQDIARSNCLKGVSVKVIVDEKGVNVSSGTG